jgi:hypothetical protein
MLREAFGEHSLSRSSVSWRWWTFWATKHQQNDRKCWKNSRTHQRRSSPNNPRARRHRWDQLCSLKFDYAPHCSFITTRPPTCPWKPEFVTNNIMVMVLHPPRSPDLAPSDFALF